jgi:hypothetical protein
VRKIAIRTLIILIVSISLLGYSILPSIADLNTIYYPLINKLIPVEPEFNNTLLISEIMYNPVSQEPGGEWIELFNKGSKTLDLSRYKIGDSETRGDSEGMYQFPVGALIEPGRVIVVANQAIIFSQLNGFQPDFELSDSNSAITDMAKYRNWAGGVINLNNSGDEVLLLDGDDNLLDSISWGDSTFAFDPPAPVVGDDQSLERRPANNDRNQAGDWVVQPEPQPGSVELMPSIPEATDTPTVTPPSCHLATMLISEVLYDSVDNIDPIGEWIELFNWGTNPIQLPCLLIGDEETKGGGEGMLSFPQDSIIQAGSVIVIANQANEFKAAFGFDPDYEIYDTDANIPDLIKIDSWATGGINLSNSGDEILLMANDETLIDAVSWGSSIFAFNPSVPLVGAGHSIARRPADKDTDTAIDWLEQIDPQPGSVQFNLPSPTPTQTGTATSTSTPTSTATSTPTSTSTPTPQPEPQLVINEIHADPDSSLGDANSDGIIDTADDEFVEFVNISSSSLDISGWTFKDALDIRHTFPAGSIIAPDCGLILFGGGTPSGLFGNSLVQIASSGNLGLNDHGDFVYLYDDTMTIVIDLSFGEEAGDNQSITRDPDITGGQPFIKHSLATGSGGSLFSPGTRIDGTQFSGCSN